MFKNNKYSIWYYNIINSSKCQVFLDGNYRELHHIIPKSMGGLNTSDNLIYLTGKQHFICHLLLTKMCIDYTHHRKMVFSFWMMQSMNNKQERKKINATSKIYENLKIERAKFVSETFKGKKKSEEFCKKISKIRKGIPHSEDRKRNISLNHHDVSGPKNPRYGIKVSDLTKKKISDTLKKNKSLAGINNPMFGKTHSNEVKRMLSEHGRNKWTPDMKKKLIETRKKNQMMKKNNDILSS